MSHTTRKQWITIKLGILIVVLFAEIFRGKSLLGRENSIKFFKTYMIIATKIVESNFVM